MSKERIVDEVNLDFALWSMITLAIVKWVGGVDIPIIWVNVPFFIYVSQMVFGTIVNYIYFRASE